MSYIHISYFQSYIAFSCRMIAHTLSSPLSSTISRDLYYHQELFKDQSLVIQDLKVQLPPGGGVGSMREHFCSMLRCNFNLYQTITLHEDTKALALISHIFTCCSCCTCRCRFCVSFTCNFNLLHRLLLASLLLSTLNRSVFISLLIAGVWSCPFNFNFYFLCYPEEHSKMFSSNF